MILRKTRNLLTAASLALCFTAQAQLTGTYTVDPAGSGANNFTTFADAVAALNAEGVGSGGAVFEVASGAVFNETPMTLTIVTNPPSAANTLVFQKSGALANPVVNVTGTSATTDAAFMLVGTDYVTFDGIAINDLGTADSDWTEYGFYLVRASATDGCQHVTIKNCTFDLDDGHTNSTAIYQRNVDQNGATLEASSAAGQHAFNAFNGNAITDCWGGIRLMGSTTIAFPDNDMRVGDDGGNTIQFGGVSTTASPFGIVIGVVRNLVIANNDVTTVAGHTANNTFGIRALSAFSGHCNVYNNNVSITADAASFGSLSPIYIGPTGGANDTVNVYNNRVEGCVMNPTESTPAIFRGLRLGSSFGTLNAYGNVIRNNTQNSPNGTNPPLPCPEGINYDGGLNFIGIHVGSNTDSTFVQNIYDNEISGSVFRQDFIGISSAGKNSFIYDNVIYNNTLSPISNASQWVLGIYLPTGANYQNVYNNVIRKLGSQTAASTNTAGIMGFFIGNQAYNIYNNDIDSIYANGGVLDGIHINQTACFVAGNGNETDTTACNIHGNNIRTLIHQGSNAKVNGIFTRRFTQGTLKLHVYNNFVSNLLAPSSGNPVALSGMRFNSGDVDASFNTVYLSGGNTAAAGFGSAGVFFDSLSNGILLRNNLIVNHSAHGAGGTTAALATNEPAPYIHLAAATDHNSYFAGTQPQSVVFTDGTTGYATLAQYQAAIGFGRDASSIGVNATFTAVNDPHTSDQGIVDAGIAIAGITTDIDNQIRSNPPDIGADEIVDCSNVTLTHTFTNATCFNCSDGTASLTAAGTAPLSFAWSNGATTQTVTDLSPGTYTACVTDAAGCEVCDTVLISFTNGIDQEDANGVTVFPNPGNGEFNVMLPYAVSGTAEIFNVGGQLISTVQLQVTKAFRVSVPAAGAQVYFLKINTGHAVLRRQIAVQ